MQRIRDFKKKLNLKGNVYIRPLSSKRSGIIIEGEPERVLEQEVVDDYKKQLLVNKSRASVMV